MSKNPVEDWFYSYGKERGGSVEPRCLPENKSEDAVVDWHHGLKLGDVRRSRKEEE